MLSVRSFYVSFYYPIVVQSRSGSKVGAVLAFLSVRYNESLPVSYSLYPYKLLLLKLPSSGPILPSSYPSL